MTIERSIYPSVEEEPQQDPVIQEMLGDIYKPDKILAQKVEQLGKNEFKITFLFPAYERTVIQLDHVSMSQMHEAILDGLICSIGQSIKNGDISFIDFQTFIDKRLDTIYFRENFSFRKMLKSNEPAELTFKIKNVEEIRLGKAFYSVTVQIDGFVQGEVECLLERPE